MKRTGDSPGTRIAQRHLGRDGQHNRPSVLFSIPKVVGDYPLKLSFGSDSNSNRTLTFVKPPASNTICAS